MNVFFTNVLIYMRLMAEGRVTVMLALDAACRMLHMAMHETALS